MPVPMIHPDDPKQKYCETCFQNNKDNLANKMYQIIKRAQMMFDIKIENAMKKVFGD